MTGHLCRQCRTPIKQPRSFCDSSCYGEWQKGRSFVEQGKPTRHRRICSVDGCGVVHFGRGYCRSHYIKLLYSPPKRVKKEPKSCIHCGTKFIAYHSNPKFCSMGCYTTHRTRPFVIKNGYKKLLRPAHPRADAKGYVFEHILVAENTLGRPLADKEEVHHIDFDKKNNSPENLTVCKNHAEHMRHHARPS